MKVFRDLFRRMGITALWFVGIFLVGVVALQIIFKATGVEGEVAVTVSSDISVRIYMLVMGIVAPLVYFSPYIEVGVTRKQFAVGICAAGALLSLCLSVLRIPWLIVDNEFSVLAVLLCAFYGALAFLVGWTAAAGFHFMRGLPIVAGIICANALCQGLIALERLQLPLLACLWITVGAILLVGAGLLWVIWRAPVRC
jgi:hypothetical protein